MGKIVRYLFVSVIAVILFIGLGYITYSAMEELDSLVLTAKHLPLV